MTFHLSLSVAVSGPWRFGGNSIDRAGRSVTSPSTAESTIRTGWSNGSNASWFNHGWFVL